MPGGKLRNYLNLTGIYGMLATGSGRRPQGGILCWTFFWPSPICYAVALAIVALLGVIEGLTLIAGISLMAAMDDWLPDADLDTDLPQGGLTALAGWLCLDRLPVLIWFVLALGCFSIAGYLLNYFSWLLTSALLRKCFPCCWPCRWRRLPAISSVGSWPEFFPKMNPVPSQSKISAAASAQ